MITVNYGDVFGAKEAMEKIKKSSLPIKTQLKLSYFFDEYDKILGKVSKSRDDLITSLGTKNDDGTITILQTDENFGKFVEELGEIFKEEVSLNCDAIDLSVIESIEMTSLEFKMIKPFIPKTEEGQ